MNDFSKVIDRYGTFCTQWDYIKDRFGKSNLLPFSISDMDFKTPDVILDAFSKRINHGIFGYSRWDHDEYKTSITSWYLKRFSYKIDKNWICYSPNVIYGISKLITLIKLKDSSQKKHDILLFTPCYDGFIKILDNNNFSYNNIHIKEDLSFSYDEFEEKCKNSKIILLCNPNNPNGKLWNEEELGFILKTAKKYGVFVISDDIHMDIVYQPNKFIPILSIAEKIDYLENTIIVTSNSKTFNIASVGGAYTLIPSKKLKMIF